MLVPRRVAIQSRQLTDALFVTSSPPRVPPTLCQPSPLCQPRAAVRQIIVRVLPARDASLARLQRVFRQRASANSCRSSNVTLHGARVRRKRQPLCPMSECPHCLGIFPACPNTMLDARPCQGVRATLESTRRNPIARTTTPARPASGYASHKFRGWASIEP